jgi:uncharacterized protein (DUF58 family)
VTAPAPALSPALAAPGVAVTAEDLRALRALAQAMEARARAEAGSPGPVVSRRRGRGLEAMDLRLFQQGDDPRHLDRHVTARTGRPHVRSFHDERALETLLVADFRPGMLWGARGRLRSVAAAMALALAAWRRAAQGGRVGLLAIGGGQPHRVRLAHGDAGAEAVIAGLAEAHAMALAAGGADADPPLDAALADLPRLIPPGGEALVASAFEGAGPRAEALLAALARRGRLRALLVRDGFEVSPPPGVYPLAEPGGGAVWARLSRRRPQADPRPAMLARIGAPFSAILSDADPEAMALAVDAADGRR